MLNIHRGRVGIWAAAIVYSIARLNFLFSPDTPHHLTADELSGWFGTKKSTVSAKASRVRHALDLSHADERFAAPHIARLFRIYESEEGLLIPAVALEPEESDRFQPLLLKPSAEEESEGAEKTVKPDGNSKNKVAPQISLFED